MENMFGKVLVNGALPVDPYDLAKAFSVISSVYRETAEMSGRNYNDNYGMEEESGLYDSDDLMRIFHGLKDWYHEESQELFLSLCWRIFALCDLIRANVLIDWVKNDPLKSNIFIPGVVVLAAASEPLSDQGGFDPGAFLRAIRQYNKG